jgi:predicted RNA-binding Zn-ribbon protein involved in translation (DUF1610 family)
MTRGWVERYIQPRPTEQTLTVVRVQVADQTCPECGSADIRRYPIANEHGARIATKCQSCLHTLRIDRPREEDDWPPFRPMTYEWEAAASERATRELLQKEIAAREK